MHDVGTNRCGRRPTPAQDLDELSLEHANTDAMARLLTFFALAALASVAIFYYAGLDTYHTLFPAGMPHVLDVAVLHPPIPFRSLVDTISTPLQPMALPRGQLGEQ